MAELADVDEEIRREQEARKRGVGLTDFGASGLDSELYGEVNVGNDGQQYVSELADEGEGDGGDDGGYAGSHPSTRALNLAQRVIADQLADGGGGREEDPMAMYRQQGGSGLQNSRVADRENEVRAM